MKFGFSVWNFEVHIWIILKILIELTLNVETLAEQNNTYSFLSGIQHTNETFMTYIPFIQNCNYSTSPNVSPGLITTQLQTPQTLFDYYKNAETIAFWTSIQNGLDIYMVQDQLFKNYDGIIYRP